jgi:hypothetical protein
MTDYVYMMVLELVAIVHALLTDPQHGRRLCKPANIAKLRQCEARAGGSHLMMHKSQ